MRAHLTSDYRQSIAEGPEQTCQEQPMRENRTIDRSMSNHLSRESYIAFVHRNPVGCWQVFGLMGISEQPLCSY